MLARSVRRAERNLIGRMRNVVDIPATGLHFGTVRPSTQEQRNDPSRGESVNRAQWNVDRFLLEKAPRTHGTMYQGIVVKVGN